MSDPTSHDIQVAIHGKYGRGPMPVEFRDALVRMVQLVKQGIDDGTIRKKRARRQPSQPETQAPADHAFLPLSGSQDAEGRYQRCGVNGCTLTPEQHERARRQPGQEDSDR